MIKVVFTYRTRTADLPELMQKLQQSADPRFDSTPSNTGISLFQRAVGDETELVLDIYYDNEADYEQRTRFERSLPEWNEIWFDPAKKHREVSVTVLDVLKR